MDSTRRISITRCGPAGSWPDQDDVAVEEPLEIRLDGHPVAVVMRTPGHDEELVAGFLVTEGILADTAAIRKTDFRAEDNRMLVFLHDEVAVDLGRLTRHVFSASSCGLCGKTTLDAIFTHSARIAGKVEIPEEVLLGAPAKLQAAQAAFTLTGGLHAAGLFSLAGELLVAREDIGRHNAVDKVIGHGLMNGLAMEATFLLVSGRVSFEILQKALAARIPAVAAISAPSSLAIEFAKESGQTLVGFLRPPGYNCY